MICEGRKGNQRANAQQMLPAGAGMARAAAGGGGGGDVTWVGQQHLFEGYCGRAPEPARPLLLRPRRLVVRVAPRPLGDETPAVARAA